MANAVHSVTITMGYKNTNFTRSYKFANISDTALANVEAKINALNASLAGGTDDGLAEFYRSDDFDASQDKGTFTKIVSAQTESITETKIFGGDN